ncbi:MAG: hypothetical protein WC908_01600 [Candidatus Paceibacterota bacterium]
MEEETKKLLEENLRLSKENNKILLKLYKIQRWAQITRIFYWFLIIGVSVGAFYFIKPYLGNLLNVYTGGVSGINNVSDITKNLKNGGADIQNLLKSLNE